MPDGTIDDDEKVFRLGLTMAGAISAGAYTGGVLDLLLEALDLHNARYEKWRANPDVTEDDDGPLPRHRVLLKVISGTSAGGMSAGLAVAGMIDARRAVDGINAPQMTEATPVEYPLGEDLPMRPGYRYRYSYRLKALHNCWVSAVDLWREEPGKEPQGLLAQDDLDQPNMLSVLNSAHIDQQVEAELDMVAWRGKAPYRFLADEFEVFLTTTNLQGVPYDVHFDALASHGMAQHAAVRHFRIRGLGSYTIKSPWLDAWEDDGIPLTLPDEAGRVPFIDRGDGKAEDEDPSKATNWSRFTASAVATGAFPIGLAARAIDASSSEMGLPPTEGTSRIGGGALPISLPPFIGEGEGRIDMRPRPNFGTGAGDAVHYVAVDGGVINNEPFELARFTLRDRAPEVDGYLAPNPREAHRADRAVIMIDPFPEGPQYLKLTPGEAEEGRNILAVMRRLMPALIGQARFKPGELIEAASSDVHSRYLIAPKRRYVDRMGRPRTDYKGHEMSESGASAIASGCFGGFGGFFDQSFRVHDFMLGQLNAHSFIARRFLVAEGNPVLNGAGADPEAKDLDEGMVPVIQPGRAFLAREYPVPAWPRIHRQTLNAIFAAAERRIALLGGKVLEGAKTDGLLRLALQRIWAGIPFLVSGANSRVSYTLRSIAFSELIARDQMHDFRQRRGGGTHNDWQRAALVAIAASGTEPLPLAMRPGEEAESRPRSIMGACERARLPGEADISLAEVRWFLDDELTAGRLWKAPKRRAGDDRYTLMDLRPPKVAYMFIRSGISRVRSWFG